MEEEILDKAQQWLSSNIDDKTKNEIRELINDTDHTALIDSFYKDLEFGTGGLRGIMGVGSNRMNKYTIGMSTQGFANYLNKSFSGQEVSVAIAHDSRNNSRFFAETAAAVLSANDIKVYLFTDLRPTPELSFAIRKLKCKGGIVVTASHNPKEYNGYKVYWDDGAQVVSPHDKNIIAEVDKIQSIDDVNFSKKDALIVPVDGEIDDAYLNWIKGNSLDAGAIARQKDLKIVFSSIHGTGITMVPKALEMLGFDNVTIVDEQANPDGDFPTVVYPNPEEEEAMKMAVEKARSLDADLVMATDPDADRVGIAIKNVDNEWQLMNGNQTAILLIDYLLRKWQENKMLDGNQYIVKTIVTADLIASLAAKYNVEYFDTLTGFKYIAELIGQLEGKKRFIGGGEESYGYLIGEEVRDKDAVASCAMIAEMAAYAKDQGKTLYESLLEIYVEHGLYKESLKSITKKGKSGAEEISEMMKGLRSDPPTSLGGSKVTMIKDYESQDQIDVLNGTKEKINLPKSNVLQFFTEDGSKVSARPSGTEPKIKFYFSVKGSLNSIDDFKLAGSELDKKIKQIENDLSLN